MPAAEAVAALDDAWAAPAFAGALAAFDRYDFAASQEPSGAPVTIAWGRYDRLLIYSRQAPRARKRLPWARHVTLGAGHVPFFDDLTRARWRRPSGRQPVAALPDPVPTSAATPAGARTVLVHKLRATCARPRVHVAQRFVHSRRSPEQIEMHGTRAS